MKKLTSILLTMLIILSTLPIQITVSAEETNEPELPEETGYSLNLPVTIYLPRDLWQPAIGMGHLIA